MSDSELSEPPLPPSDDDISMSDNLFVPNLLSSQLSLPLSSQPQLSPTNSPLFTKRLFTKRLFTQTLLDTDPPNVFYKCTQTGCKFSPPLKPLSTPLSGTLWKHYQSVHLAIAVKHCHRNAQSLTSSPSSVSSRTSFFKPRLTSSRHVETFRKRLLNFVVSNNLPLLLVDGPSFQTLI